MHKIILYFSCAVSGLFSGAVLANDVLRGNVGIESYRINSTDRYIDKFSGNSVFTTVYLTSVSKDNHPWKEAAFLQRASNISVFVGKFRQYYNNMNSSNYLTQGSIGGTYAARNLALVLSGEIGRRIKNPPDSGVTVVDAINLSVGSYVGKNILLTLDYDMERYSLETYAVAGKFFYQFTNQMAFGLLVQGGYLKREYDIQSSEGNSIQFSPEVYFNHTTSLGFDYSQEYYGVDNRRNWRAYQLMFHKFLGQKFAVEASLTKYIESVKSISARNYAYGLRAELWF